MRLIDADALLEFFKNNSNGDYTEWFLETIEDVIKNAPTIQREVQDKLAGWKLVPIKATESMLQAAIPEIRKYESIQQVYEAMLNAAPPNTEVGE